MNASTVGSSGRMWSPRGLRGAARRLAPDGQAAQPKVMLTPGRPAQLSPGAHRAAPVRRRTRAAVGRGADGCAGGHQRPSREAILAGDRDAEARSKENAMAVICGITRDTRQHKKDSS